MYRREKAMMTEVLYKALQRRRIFFAKWIIQNINQKSFVYTLSRYLISHFVYNIIIKHKCYRKKIETQNKLDLPMGSWWTEKHIEDEFVNLAFWCILQENKNKYENTWIYALCVARGIKR